MKFLSLAALVLVTACGNPHISSSRGGVEKVTPPLSTEDPSCGTGIMIETRKFYFGSDAEMKALNECRTETDETFNNEEPGPTDQVQGGQDVTWTIDHQSETDSEPDKAVTLAELFGNEKFKMNIENPLMIDGQSGKDHGLDSLSANNGSKDALIWSFSSPVTSWGVYPVNLKAFNHKKVSLRLFDCNETLIDEAQISSSYGFIGFASFKAEVCHVSLTAADNTSSVGVEGFIFAH